MQKNLTTRTVIIVVTILVCIFGIIGVPKSKADLVNNMQNNIRLGLDLKGGSHLVLEVQVQDAIKADADHTMDLLRKHPQQEFIQVDTTNILFICGGAFNDLENIISKRLGVNAMGFGAENKK